MRYFSFKRKNVLKKIYQSAKLKLTGKQKLENKRWLWWSRKYSFSLNEKFLVRALHMESYLFGVLYPNVRLLHVNSNLIVFQCRYTWAKKEIRDITWMSRKFHGSFGENYTKFTFKAFKEAYQNSCSFLSGNDFR